MRLGELLVQKKLLDPAELEKALAMQASRPEKLGRILADLGFVAARDVLTALSEQLGIPVAAPADYPTVTPEIEGLSPRFPHPFAQQFGSTRETYSERCSRRPSPCNNPFQMASASVLASGTQAGEASPN